jgi:hypothetical protein
MRGSVRGRPGNWPSYRDNRIQRLERYTQPPANGFGIPFQRIRGWFNLATFHSCYGSLRGFHPFGHLCLRKSSLNARFYQCPRQLEFRFHGFVRLFVIRVFGPFPVQVI